MAINKDSLNPVNTDTDTYSSEATHPGKRGDHPLGGAVGAAVGGMAGAAMGSPAGPLGVIAGAGVGGVAGALAGKGIAQSVNPTTEDAYWRDNYKDRSYIESGASYDTYQPAYRHGIEGYTRYEGRNYQEVEPNLRSDWENSPNSGTLPWEKAQPATRDAYERLSERGFTEEDINKTTGE